MGHSPEGGLAPGLCDPAAPSLQLWASETWFRDPEGNKEDTGYDPDGFALDDDEV